MAETGAGLVVCVDVGSTFTKAALVDVETGALRGTAAHATTLTTDVLDGVDACRAALAVDHPEAADAPVLACSSAGGGLRIAVVGAEDLVTAEAGRRVALSSGGKIALVSSGGLDATKLEALRAGEPDVLLLVGGTDGGNAEVLEADARVLAEHRWPGPVVVAGNVESQPVVAAAFEESGTTYVLADNVVPRIGVLAPGSARQAVREVFLAHVIGGKGLSARADFAAMVQGPTPDLVLTGVEVLARVVGGGGVAVVDIGGATTDVHSVVPLDPEDAGLSREVVASTPVTRTVEGDLGMRWSALSTWEAGREAGLLGEDLRAAAELRSADPGFLPGPEEDWQDDLALAGAAAALAVRRHVGRSRVVVGPDGRRLERTGKDLREIDLLVGSGGVLRHAPGGAAHAMLASVVGASPEGWQQPERARVVVDQHYVLAAIGLLAGPHCAAAEALARSLAGCEEIRGS